ncbi:hypothetical protein [Laspinema olomoucense]|uniref:Uncharacterized protein n=1 Tax=Laspinema olomoucense D3b TaxID=2953688 RepID=A0ABT2NCY9_9CYAN|nr:MULTISPECIES: hypothetical protein [unclassified Laspinema]MCT7980559.1 hypothetical protein [Laspinema sp. D3b]MCT7992625.1 hypothetical protein [Laspinema sp. D3c]
MDGVSQFVSHPTRSYQTDAIALQALEIVDLTGLRLKRYSIDPNFPNPSVWVS